jgi:hypothetical protein
MFLSGVQSELRLDSRQRHTGTTGDGWPIDLTQQAARYQKNPNRSKTPAKAIPKCEYRNPKQAHKVKSQLQNPQRRRLEH